MIAEYPTLKVRFDALTNDVMSGTKDLSGFKETVVVSEEHNPDNIKKKEEEAKAAEEAGEATIAGVQLVAVTDDKHADDV